MNSVVSDPHLIRILSVYTLISTCQNQTETDRQEDTPCERDLGLH